MKTMFKIKFRIISLCLLLILTYFSQTSLTFSQQLSQTIKPNAINQATKFFDIFNFFKPSPVQNQQKSSTGLVDIYQAQKDHLKHVEVIVKAKVYKMLSYDLYGLPHERFLIKLNNNSTVLIAHDLKMAPCVPLKANDDVTIKGEYIWNNLGGVIHWTHHTDTAFHVGGYILFNNKTYQ